MTPAAPTAGASRPLALSVGVLSGSALAYEILLMRLFSIIQWHHFAYMIISLALLGYGASGVFLALYRDWLSGRFAWTFPAGALLFGVAAPVCFWLAQRVPFNPAEIFWAPSQLLYLFLLYLLLALPFFCVASTIGLALYRFSEQVSGIYAADLLGAGAGSLAVIALLFLLAPEQVLLAIALLGIAAVLPVCITTEYKGLCLAGCMVAGVFLLAAPQHWKALHVSPYKELRQLLRIPGTRIVDSFSSPIGYVDVVESSKVPLRYAPGLSLNATAEPPEQYAVFTDADNMTALTRYNGNPQSIAYLDQTTSALPYHLHKPEHLLVLGAGAGVDLLQARFFGVKNIDAVELNGQLPDHIRAKYDAFSGGIFSGTDVKLHIGEARGFVASSKQRYDMIQIALMDAFGASSAGLYALSENYLYTVEAVRQYLRHLKPEGYLAITRWVKMPPRDTLKLFATVVTALESMGKTHVGQQMILIRGWQTSTLLVKNGTISPEEIATLKTFCGERSFDIDFYPGITAAETNRFNILTQSYYYDAALALLSPERSAFVDNYKFDIRPATDNRPYFFQFFKWTTLPEILSLYRQGGISLLESGYIILVAGALQALVASVMFLGLPLFICKDKLGFNLESKQVWRMLGFFFCLGLAFLFVEIAFIQKFILFLHHPLYSVTVVLSSFLIAAGVGSVASRHFMGLRDGQYHAVGGIVVLGLLYIASLGGLTSILLDQPTAVKVAVSILLIAPLGFFMGVPFPLGLDRVRIFSPELIPWAWAINGFASVISAIVATLIAIHWGFDVLIVDALILYMLAAVLLPERPRAVSE